MYEPLIIATTVATGASLAIPEEYDQAFSTLLSVLSVSAGMYGLHMARQDQSEAAFSSGMASVIFSLLNLAKSLGLV